LPFLAFVQDKDTQSRDAETQYNRLDTMQNRTHDITRQYWILNDQYRLLNTTIVNALENHEKVKNDFEKNVSRKSLVILLETISLFSKNVMQNSNTIKDQVDMKLIPLKIDTDSINNRSSIALENIKDIKSQADIHVRRIEKVSEIGKNLTNDINSARGQVGKLLEQLLSLQNSLSKTSLRINDYSLVLFFRSFNTNQYHTFR
jgi:chromosome segregation ATPase